MSAATRADEAVIEVADGDGYVIAIDEQPAVGEGGERGLPRVPGEVGLPRAGECQPVRRRIGPDTPKACVKARRTRPPESSRAAGAIPSVLTPASRVQSYRFEEVAL